MYIFPYNIFVSMNINIINDYLYPFRVYLYVCLSITNLNWLNQSAYYYIIIVIINNIIINSIFFELK